jgi:hypothetical protein
MLDLDTMPVLGRRNTRGKRKSCKAAAPERE